MPNVVHPRYRRRRTDAVPLLQQILLHRRLPLPPPLRLRRMPLPQQKRKKLLRVVSHRPPRDKQQLNTPLRPLQQVAARVLRLPPLPPPPKKPALKRLKLADGEAKNATATAEADAPATKTANPDKQPVKRVVPKQLVRVQQQPPL